MVNMKTREPQKIDKEPSGAFKKSEGNAELIDPFLQIIMSLLPQLEEQSSQQQDSTSGTGTVELSELAALFQSSPRDLAALQSLLQSGDPREGAALSSANSTNTVALMSLLAKSETPEGAINSTTDNVTGANVTPSGYTEQPTDISGLLNLVGKGADNAGNVAISSSVLTQLTDLLGLSSKNEMQTLLKNVGIEVTEDVVGSVQSGISEAVVKAKELLSEYLQQQQSDKDELDVDKLQNEFLKTDKTAPFEIRFKSVGNAADSKVLDQITDGIKQNISLGKSEFTIKLKPEALGEITVKLVEEAGKTTLTITAAKAQTAKLINNDLDALRAAVAPMKVEVRDAVVSTNETASGSMQQFNMTGQQFAGQQFAGHQSFMQMSQAASTQAGNQSADDVYESSQVAQLKFQSSDRLDAYI